MGLGEEETVGGKRKEERETKKQKQRSKKSMRKSETNKNRKETIGSLDQKGDNGLTRLKKTLRPTDQPDLNPRIRNEH